MERNRQLRDEKYRQKQELNVINIKYKEEEMLRTIREEYRENLDMQEKRQREINIDYKLQARQQNYRQCLAIVGRLIC